MRRTWNRVSALIAVALLAAGLFAALWPLANPDVFLSWQTGPLDWAWLWLTVQVPVWLCDLGVPMGNLLVGEHYGTPYLTLGGLLAVYTLPGAVLGLVLLRRRSRRQAAILPGG